MKMMKQVLNNKGVTLTELIVTIMVVSIILSATVSVVGPVLRAFERANSFAEANTLLDNLAALIMHDVANAREIEPLEGLIGYVDDEADGGAVVPARLTILTSRYVFLEVHEIDGLNILTRHDEYDGDDPVPLLAGNYYRGKSVSVGWIVENGIVTIHLTLRSANGWEIEREYVARPLGLEN